MNTGRLDNSLTNGQPRVDSHRSGIAHDEEDHESTLAPIQPRPGLARIIGRTTIIFTALYLISDLLEVAQGGFSMLRLSLTLASEAAIPFFVLGLYAVQRPRIGRLGLFGAMTFAYSYVFFTGTVLVALVERTPNYHALTKYVGALMTVHGLIMIVGGLVFGLAVMRARVLPRWTGACLMVGVVLVAGASGLSNIARMMAEAVSASAFLGMGYAVLQGHSSHQRIGLTSRHSVKSGPQGSSVDSQLAD